MAQVFFGCGQHVAKEAGFPRLDRVSTICMKAYRSPELFPVFQEPGRKRVMNRSRPDFAAYLRNLNLPDGADPIEILAVNGGSRVTDAYEVFPKLVKQEDGSFTCRFFLHGWRHVSQAAQHRRAELTQGEKLYMTLELANPATGLAVQIQTTDYHMIGWTPRYLAHDLAKGMNHASTTYEAKVVRTNPQSASSEQHVLIEMTGNWGQHEPMIGDDFEPLVPDTP